MLSKHKDAAKTQFINAGGEEFFKKETNNNVLTDDHIAKIIDIFSKKEEVQYVATTIDNSRIAENDYNLSVSSYVEAKDTREIIDIRRLNEDLDRIVAHIDCLRTGITEIIKTL